MLFIEGVVINAGSLAGKEAEKQLSLVTLTSTLLKKVLVTTRLLSNTSGPAQFLKIPLCGLYYLEILGGHGPPGPPLEPLLASNDCIIGLIFG